HPGPDPMGLHREAVDTTAVLPFVRIGTACYLREESRYELLGDQAHGKQSEDNVHLDLLFDYFDAERGLEDRPGSPTNRNRWPEIELQLRRALITTRGLVEAPALRRTKRHFAQRQKVVSAVGKPRSGDPTKGINSYVDHEGLCDTCLPGNFREL